MGDSHCRAISAAAEAMGVPMLGGMFGIAKVFTRGLFDRFEATLRDGGRTPAAVPKLTQAFAARLGPTELDTFRGRCVICMGMASVHLFNSQDWRRYDFGAAADPRKHFISRAVLDAITAELTGPSVEFVEHMASRGLLLAAIAGPPPLATQRAVEILGPAKVRQLVELYEAPTRAVLAKYGVPLVAADGVTDAAGLLLPAYSAGDNVHGNAEYGALLLRKVLALLPPAERDAMLRGAKEAQTTA